MEWLIVFYKSYYTVHVHRICMSAITADTRRRNHTKTMHPALGRCLKTPQSAVKSCQDHKQRYSSVNNPKQPTRQSANSITNNQPLITRTINKIKKKNGNST